MLTGNATIDTSTGEVVDGDGAVVTVQSAMVLRSPVELMVISAASFDVANVSVRGSRALAVMVSGDVVVRGALSVSATHATGGPGALAQGGSCIALSSTQGATGSGGGGGGGFGTAGGRGGDGGGTTGGAGGAASGTVDLQPLRGGCTGVHSVGYIADPVDEQPGAGGGALQISARGSIVIQAGATITSNGGGAKGWTGQTTLCPTNANHCDAGSGGGSGGGILLESARLDMAASAALTANGGAGHCGFGGLALDGATAETAAPGTDCSGTTGDGGNGGAGGSEGGPGSTGTRYGGGGGGGVGRIRINLPEGQTFDAGPPIVSPPPSMGVAATR